MQLRGTVLIGERKKENGLRLNNWRDYLGANFFVFGGRCFLWLEYVLTKYNKKAKNGKRYLFLIKTEIC